MTIYFCSSNAGKLREFALAAEETEFLVSVLPGMDTIAAPAETGLTFEENAIAKALFYSRYTHGLVLTDDSGLEVDALGGAPGVRSARFAGEKATDRENNEMLLQRMAGMTNRAARFVSVVALAMNERMVIAARGEVEGTLTQAPQGEGGFGYDPLFFYQPFERTLAEVSPLEKLSVSHRGRALRAAFQKLKAKRAGAQSSSG